MLDCMANLKALDQSGLTIICLCKAQGLKSLLLLLFLWQTIKVTTAARVDTKTS